MHDTTEFAALMEQLRAGRREALRDLHDRYSEHVLRVVRKRLDHRLRQQFDSTDFVQAVWASFVAVPPERFDFSEPEALIVYLAQMARNKVIEEVRSKLETKRRDLTREEPLGNHDHPTDQPSASQLLIADEEWDRLLEGQSPQVRLALQMLREGATHEQVAQKLRLYPKAVQRLLQRVQRKLQS